MAIKLETNDIKKFKREVLVYAHRTDAVADARIMALAKKMGVTTEEASEILLCRFVASLLEWSFFSSAYVDKEDFMQEQEHIREEGR